MKKIEILLVSAAALLLSSSLYAGDSRVWTSRKGTTLEGELLKADTASVTIVDKTGRTLPPIKMEDLSIGDRQYIVQYSKVDPKILALGEPGEPEKEYRVDEKTFVRDKENKVELGAAQFEIMRTEHFLIAYAGDIRPNAVGEAAERIWHGMAFQHMDFRKDWTDQRRLIILAVDRKAHEAAGKWYFQYLKDSGKADEAGQAATLWDETDTSAINLPPDLMKKYSVLDEASYFNARQPEGLKKALSPTLIHTLAIQILQKQTGPTTEVGKKGAIAFYQGHAFYKEMELCGLIGTSLVSTAGTDNLAKVSHEGFKDNSWAKTLRGLVKKGTVTPSVTQTLSWAENDLTPEHLALMYALSYYMQSTNLRLSYYAEVVRRISTSHGIPTPEEFAKLFGFDSVAAFDADWTTFIKEGNFK